MRSNIQVNTRSRHRNRFRDILLRERSEVGEQMQDHRRFLQTAGNADPSESFEIASNELEAGVLAFAVETDSNRLSQIEDALDRLEHNRYGICGECGRKIGRARLEALPYASLCIKCQSNAEAQGSTWQPARVAKSMAAGLAELDLTDDDEDSEPVALDCTDTGQIEASRA